MSKFRSKHNHNNTDNDIGNIDNIENDENLHDLHDDCDDDDGDHAHTDDPHQEDQDWGIVAMVVDRMFLWVFGAAAVVSADDDCGDEVDSNDDEDDIYECLTCG